MELSQVPSVTVNRVNTVNIVNTVNTVNTINIVNIVNTYQVWCFEAHLLQYTLKYGVQATCTNVIQCPA